MINQLSPVERKEDGVWNEINMFKQQPTTTTIIPLLRKFIYLAKKSTEGFRFKSLNEQSMSLLGDVCHFSLKNEFSQNKTVIIFIHRSFNNSNRADKKLLG